MKRILEKLVSLKDQIIRFLIVGFITTGIDFAILILLKEVAGWPGLAANAVSFTCNVVTSYFLSVKYVYYTDRKSNSKDLGIYIFLSLIGLGINQGVYYLGCKIGFHYLISKCAATGVSMVYNYITRKRFLER